MFFNRYLFEEIRNLRNEIDRLKRDRSIELSDTISRANDSLDTTNNLRAEIKDDNNYYRKTLNTLIVAFTLIISALSFLGFNYIKSQADKYVKKYVEKNAHTIIQKEIQIHLAKIKNYDLKAYGQVPSPKIQKTFKKLELKSNSSVSCSIGFSLQEGVSLWGSLYNSSTKQNRYMRKITATRNDELIFRTTISNYNSVKTIKGGNFRILFPKGISYVTGYSKIYLTKNGNDFSAPLSDGISSVGIVLPEILPKNYVYITVKAKVNSNSRNGTYCPSIQMVSSDPKISMSTNGVLVEVIN